MSDSMDAAYQALPSMGFSRQEYWSGLPFWTLRLRAASLADSIAYRCWRIKYVMGTPLGEDFGN